MSKRDLQQNLVLHASRWICDLCNLPQSLLQVFHRSFG
jgi:hypothetical protein